MPTDLNQVFEAAVNARGYTMDNVPGEVAYDIWEGIAEEEHERLRDVRRDIDL